jgi:hypothetical protein
MPELVSILIPAATAIIGGVIVSLLGPWAKWDIEKRKQRVNARREFIAAARAGLVDPPDRDKFRESSLYSQLLPHLSARSLERLQSNSIIVQHGGRGGGVNNYAASVLDDICALEKKWGLL